MTAGRQAVAYVINNTANIEVQQADISGAAASTGIPLENGQVILMCSGSYRV